MNNNSGIYKLQSKTFENKFYIGSAVNLRKRKNLHFSSLVNNRHHSRKLQNFVNKYGISDIEFIVLEECEKLELIKKEQEYINNLNPTLNILKIAGSSLGNIHSEETKLKISIGNKGKIVSDETKSKMSEIAKNMSKETREKISNANKGRVVSDATRKKLSIAGIGRFCTEETRKKLSELNKGENNSMFGKEISQETREKIRKASSKKALQYDLFNVFLREWNSFKEAANSLGVKDATNLIACAKGRFKQSHGFIWKYKVKEEM